MQYYEMKSYHFQVAEDTELRDQMIKAGCWKIRAYIWYIMVRLFGINSAKKGNLQGKEIKQSC